MVARKRVTPVFSTSQATAGSIREIAELHAANMSNKKKMAAKTLPKGICPKAMGSVVKISPGPELGSRPLANTIGKIAIPASNATAVSAKAIAIPAPAMDTFLGKYAP